MTSFSTDSDDEELARALAEIDRKEKAKASAGPAVPESDDESESGCSSTSRPEGGIGETLTKAVSDVCAERGTEDIVRDIVLKWADFNKDVEQQGLDAENFRTWWRAVHRESYDIYMASKSRASEINAARRLQESRRLKQSWPDRRHDHVPEKAVNHKEAQTVDGKRYSDRDHQVPVEQRASFDRSRAKQRSKVGQQSRGMEPEKSSEGEAGEARDDSDGEDGDEHSDDWYSDDD